MGRLSISRTWEETRAIMARDGKLLATVAAAMFLLPQLLVGLVTGEKAPAAAGNQYLLLMTLALLIGLVGQLAVVRLSLGSNVSVGEAIRHGFRRAPPFILAMLLLCLAAVSLLLLLSIVLVMTGTVGGDVQNMPPRDVGLIFLLIFLPLLFFMVRLLPVAAVASAEDAGPIAIIRRSWALTGGQFWRLAGFLVLFLIAAVVLTLALGMLGGLVVKTVVGPVEPFTLAALVLSLFTAAAQTVVTLVYVVMLARIYTQLAGSAGAEAEASVPSSGT